MQLLYIRRQRVLRALISTSFVCQMMATGLMSGTKKPFCLAQWGARPTPDMILSLVYASGAAWNESNFSHERFDKVLVEARAELDQTKRAEQYRELQQIIRDDCGVVVPFFKNYVYARRSNVQHGDGLTGTWPLDGYKALERWWFAS